MQDRIICLVGKSGTGKTTIAKTLEEEFGLEVIHSYTTRPRRPGENWGHIFSDRGRLFQLKRESPEFIISEVYYNNEYYWSETWQYKNKGTSVYVIDPRGVEELKKNVKDAEIIVIYLYCNTRKRLKRIISRGESRRKARERATLDKTFFKEIDQKQNYDLAINTEENPYVCANKIMRFIEDDNFCPS